MSQMGRTVCVADPPPCLADSMAPPTSLATTTVSLALVTSAPPERRRHSPCREALSAHRAFVRETLALPRVRWVRTVSDLMAVPAGGLGVLFGTQYAPRGMTEATVGEWRAARLQSMAPFAGTSEYGGGFERDGGLTERGRQLIKWLGRHKIIVDLSNAGSRTARETITFIKQENVSVYLMASHSGCYSIFPHPRNLPDDVLRGIADLGGYIGIPVLESVLDKSGTDVFRALARHISHANKVCGSDSVVGIGSSISTDFRVLEERLNWFLQQKTVGNFLGRNFEFFLLRPLP